MIFKRYTIKRKVKNKTKQNKNKIIIKNVLFEKKSKIKAGGALLNGKLKIC
jgi:hypothetical protein